MKRTIAAFVACTLINTGHAGDIMQININGTNYAVKTERNDTTADIMDNLPMELNMAQYAGHEYFSTLPFVPRETATQTSELLPGHVYWWGAGNAFVINYAPSNIAPYHSVHIGEITDVAAMDELRRGGTHVKIIVSK